MVQNSSCSSSTRQQDGWEDSLVWRHHYQQKTPKAFLNTLVRAVVCRALPASARCCPLWHCGLGCCRQEWTSPRTLPPLPGGEGGGGGGRSGVPLDVLRKGGQLLAGDRRLEAQQAGQGVSVGLVLDHPHLDVPAPSSIRALLGIHPSRLSGPSQHRVLVLLTIQPADMDAWHLWAGPELTELLRSSRSCGCGMALGQIANLHCSWCAAS